MKKKINWVLAAFVFTICTSMIQAQEATDAQIKNLLEVMQSEQQFIVGIDSMVEMQKDSPQAAMIPEGFFEEYVKEAKSAYTTELLPKFIEVYKRNLTADEVIALTEFYSTDIGKLMLNKMPAIQMESAQVGMVWGQEAGMRIMQKFMKED